VQGSPIRRMFFALCCTFLGFSHLCGEEPRPLIVGCDANYPPYEFQDDQGRPSGFNVDLIRELAKEAGIPIAIRMGPFKEIREDFESGRIDILAGWSFSEERASHYLFTVPHTLISWSLFVRRDGPQFRSEADLAGLTILAQKGDTNFDYLVSKNYHVVGVSTPEDAFRELAAGKGDCAIITKGVGLYILRRDGIAGIKRLEVNLQYLKYCIAVHKGEEELLGRLNEAIFVLKESGRFREIHDQHFAALEQTELSLGAVLKRTLFILLPIGTLFLVFLAWSWSLRGQVRKRTLALREELAERKKAEEALLKWRQIFEHAKWGVVVLSADGETLDLMNPAFAEMHGYTQQELYRTRMLDLFVPESRAWVPHQLRQIRDANHYAFESLHLRKDGTSFPVLVGASSVKDDQGKVLNRIINLQDITEQKNAEKERTHLEEQLRQSQKLEALGQLAGGVAHDINNMLTAILGFSQIMEEKLSPSDPLQHFIQQMTKVAHRSEGIVRQLLAFSRKQIVETRILDLNELIGETRKGLTPLIGEDITLQFQPQADLWKIVADPSHMDQIFMNLILNARDAMPRGGTITLRTANIHIDETYGWRHLEAASGPYVHLSVSDEGIGMDRTTLDRIFEPFFTTKEVGKGTGLGLSTVFGIVKQAGGFLDVYSELGRGTTFNIYLPATPDASRQVHLEEALTETLPPDLSVLVVEDDLILREVIPLMLERLGCRVQVADTPAQALVLCSQVVAPFDLVLSDLVMPGMNGKELLEKIHEQHPGTRMLLMSGYTGDVLARQGVLDEAMPFIQKPFTVANLSRKLAKVMG